MERIDGGNIGHLGKLHRQKKYEEGYDFGIEQLTNWPNRKKPNQFQFMNDVIWWTLFGQTCDCAIEVERNDVLATLCNKGARPIHYTLGLSKSLKRLAKCKM
jgi:hypothetical protein